MLQSLLSLLLASSLTLGSYAPPENTEAFDDKTLLSVSSVPMQKAEMVEPAPVNAASVLAVDLDTQASLYERNALGRVPIASLTKLMTAAIILEENDPSAIVTVSANAANATGSSMGLYLGEEITVKNLLYGLLIVSGNDAAIALAEYNAGNETAFIEKMNQMANKLGLVDTHYANTTGLDSEAAYSTARDLVTLSSHLLQDDSVREIINNSKVNVTSVNGTAHELINTNILLGQLGIKGFKTGKTVAAGECLITLAESPEGREVITVVLGSSNRFADTKILLDWIYRAFTW